MAEEDSEAIDEIGGGGEGGQNDDRDRLVKGGGEGASKKGRSCAGCLYYSSTLQSNSRNPLCVGISRSIPQVPRYYVGESEIEASREGRSLADFRYSCIGYSVYSDRNNHSGDIQETQKTDLPVCAGLEILVDRRISNAESTPAHVHHKDGHGIPPPRTPKPASTAGDDFFSRFTRNANLVANGVAKNVRKAANHLKESIDDILYPYRRRPK